MDWMFQIADLGDNEGQCLCCVQTFFLGKSGVAGAALDAQFHFCPTSLADAQPSVVRLTSHCEIGLEPLHKPGQRCSFNFLLAHAGDQGHRTGEGARGSPGRCYAVGGGGDGRLLIADTQAVEPSIDDLAPEWVHGPAIERVKRYGVDMSVNEQSGSVACPHDADGIPGFIDLHLVKSESTDSFRCELDRRLFSARLARRACQRLGEINKSRMIDLESHGVLYTGARK